MSRRPVARLAAILHADIVGSTLLVRRNQLVAHIRMVDTFRRLSATVSSFGGTAHEVRGDALVAEFARPSDAVAAALAFQKDNEARNASLDDDIRPRVRIGLSLGEVIVADETLTGEDVVRAQRLEELAEPGGVCVSENIRQSIPRRMPFTFRLLGPRTLKGFDEPVLVSAVRITDGRTLEPEEGSYDRVQPEFDFTPVETTAMAYVLPDKPSIAVLPFTTLGPEPDASLLGDGVAECVIATLAADPGLFVMARNATSALKGAAPTDVSMKLGVRYVLDGTVQRASNRLRVSTRLDDAIEGRTMWSDRLDCTMEDVFDMQDEIARRITENLQVKLTLGVQARTWLAASNGLDPYLRMLRGRACFQSWTLEGHLEAKHLWGELATEHPDSFFSFLAGYIHWQRIPLGISEDPEADLAEALEIGRAAASRFPDIADVHAMVGIILADLGEFDDALQSANRAIATAPGNADVNQIAGAIHVRCGEPAMAAALLERGLRYQPNSPSWVGWMLRHALIVLGRYQEATAHARAVLAPSTGDANAHALALLHLSAIASFEGRYDEGKACIRKLYALTSEWSVATVRRRLGRHRDTTFIERFLGALSGAGLRDN